MGRWSSGKLVGTAAGGAGVFATYPAFDTTWRNFLSEFLGTAVLLLGVRALTDRRNAAPGGYVEPLALGALVWAIGLSLGGLTGYAINPARDLGPRLASALLGWGTAVFQSHGGYFWIPIVAPFAGGIAGIFLYDFAIHRNLPPEGDPARPANYRPESSLATGGTPSLYLAPGMIHFRLGKPEPHVVKQLFNQPGEGHLTEGGGDVGQALGFCPARDADDRAGR